ncbi:unnamed protein product [Dracunculus medinensis]|uniref:Uncharacterized protein n=1 Tax=Dracunculus medinensis TaxID=318479 RepID=A0A0N4UMC9_DRAME|nr:unnamed protein product [Dracunculus medinensis]
MGEKIEKVEKSEKHVRDYIDEIEQRARTQCENQSLIRNSTPLSEDQLGKLDSTLKRATAFMKKLKNIGADKFIEICRRNCDFISRNKN